MMHIKFSFSVPRWLWWMLPRRLFRDLYARSLVSGMASRGWIGADASVCVTMQRDWTRKRERGE